MKIHEYREMMKYLTRPDVSKIEIPMPAPQAPAEPREMSNEEHAAHLNAQIEQGYATGGRVQMAGGGDPEKIARIKELVQSGEYNKKQIIDILEEEGYGRVRTGKDSIVNTIADELKVDLPVGMTQKGLAAHEAKGKYLPFYNNEKLETDLKKGKTISDISKDLYKNNTKFYNKIGITEDNLPVLNSALNSKIAKNKDFVDLHNDNLTENVKQQKQVLKDVNSFIKDNKQKYLDLYNTNKVGAPDQFKNDLIDFIEEKHPDFIKTTETYNPKNPLAKGSKVLDLPDLYERNVTRAGDYGRDVFLKKKIRESLGIAERPAKGEGISLDRMARNYNTTTQELLKGAQEEGIIPKINPITKTPINNETSYYKYARQLGVDPINKLFEGNVKFGVEHVGGIARAGKINDYETLDKVLAFDSNVNRNIKSTAYDNRLTKLIDIAKQAEPDKAKEYIKTINSLVAEGEKKYGIPLTRYKMVNDEIVSVHPNISLTDSNFKKSKLAIDHFITNDGLNHPNFEKLDPDLQKAIVNYSKDKTKEADSLLKGVLKEKGLSSEIIPGMRNILDSKILNNLIEVGSPAVNSIIKNASSFSKATGLPFNAGVGALFNSEKMQQEGLSVLKSLFYGGVKGASEDLLNFGAQILAAGPLMSKTLFDATIDAKKQPPEGIDSFDQIGGKQGAQSKFFNELFSVAPVDISEIPYIGSKWAVEQQSPKETIDNLVNVQTRKMIAELYPASNISETTVPGENNIMQQQKEDIKKNLYQEVFKNENLKKLYEQDLLKEKQIEGAEVKPKGLYNAEVITPNVPQEYSIGGRVGYAEGSNDELEIPTLNEEKFFSGPTREVSKEGITGIYYGAQDKPRVGYKDENFDIAASKNFNKLMGDTKPRYEASYTPNPDVGTFSVNKGPGYIGANYGREDLGNFSINKTPFTTEAGYNYDKGNLSYGIQALVDKFGNKDFKAGIKYKY